MLGFRILLLSLTVFALSDHIASAVDDHCLDDHPRYISVTGTVFEERSQCESHMCPDSTQSVTNKPPLLAVLNESFCVKDLQNYVNLEPFHGTVIEPLTIRNVRLVESLTYTGPSLRELAKRNAMVSLSGMLSWVPPLDRPLPYQIRLLLSVEHVGTNTDVIAAVRASKLDAVREALQAGVDVNQVDERGYTALMYAVVYGTASLDLVEVLLQGGADPNRQDSQGGTALSVTASAPL